MPKTGIINRNPQGLSGIRITRFRIRALARAPLAMRATLGTIWDHFGSSEFYFGELDPQNTLLDLKILLQTHKIHLRTINKWSEPRI